MVIKIYDELPIVNVKQELSTAEIDKKFWEYFDLGPTSSTLISSNVTSFSDSIEPRDARGPILVVYSVLFVIGALGNVAVLIGLSKSRRRKSRVDMLMTHLVLADICVTCGVIPLEVRKFSNLNIFKKIYYMLIFKMSKPILLFLPSCQPL